MKLITEITEEIQYITEARDDGKKDLYIEGIFLQGGIKNRNGRVYPVNILAKEVERYTESHIKKNRAYGELGHPNGPTINLDRVSHLIKEIRQDGNNFIGKAKITDTPMGNIVKNLIAEGAGIGVSSRGLGTVVSKDGVNEVQSDFHLATPADIVADPSAPEAWVNGIMESAEWIFDERLGWKAVQVAEQQQEMFHKEYSSLNEEALLKQFKRFLNTIGNS
jgi:hypothetical protein